MNYCLTPYGQSLALRYWPLARHFARGFVRAYPHLETEIQTAAMLALIEAAAGCPPGNRRSGYFGTVVKRRLVDEVRTAHRKRHDCRRNQPLELADTARIEPDAEDAAWWLLALLPPREAEVIRANVIEGLSYRAIGLRMGLKQHAAFRLAHRGLERLRDHPRVRVLVA